MGVRRDAAPLPDDVRDVFPVGWRCLSHATCLSYTIVKHIIYNNEDI